MGQRTTLEDNVWIKVEDDNARIVIGEFVFLGRGCEIDSTLSVTIGNKTLIAPNVFITDHNHNINRHQMIVDQGCTAKAVVIQDDVWIGAQAVILAGVIIHRGAVIAAGAVVNRNVPEYEVWGGVPARRISVRSVVVHAEEVNNVDY
jgi:acetyltransferase-like isoleucine patch superfamily enzyme